MKIATTLSECGITVEFEENYFTIKDEFSTDKNRSHIITLSKNDLCPLEKIFRQWHKIQEEISDF
jgi:hypothetical protein